MYFKGQYVLSRKKKQIEVIVLKYTQDAKKHISTPVNFLAFDSRHALKDESDWEFVSKAKNKIKDSGSILFVQRSTNWTYLYL